MEKLVGLAMVSNRNLFVVEYKEIWTIPGGAVNKDEKDLAAITRIAKAQLGVDVVMPTFYGIINGYSAYDVRSSDIHVYMVKFFGDMRLSRDIRQVEWMHDAEKGNITEATRKLMQKLIKDYYLPVPFKL